MSGPWEPDHPAVVSKRHGRQFLVHCTCGHKHWCVLSVATDPDPQRRNWWGRRRRRTELLDEFLRAWDEKGAQ